MADGTGSGGVEDYPSIAQVAEDLAAANLTPIFAVQPDDTVPDAFDELQIYADLLADLNAVDPSIGGSVVTLSNDSSDLANVILAGLEHATISDMLMS